MKNRKIIIVLSTVLATLVIVPMSVLAVNNLISKIPVVPEGTFSKEELLKEKAEYFNNIGVLDTYTVQNVLIDEKLDNKLKEDNNNVQKTENTIISVMSKYNSKKFTNILDKLEKANSETDEKEKAQYELYGLIFDTLENEHLSIEESNVLKEFIRNQSFEIKKNQELQVKFEKLEME